jgi:hypothetical protein
MVTSARPYLEPERLRLLLASARIVDLGLSTKRFQETVTLQRRLKTMGYRNLSPQETDLAADIWERLKQYVREQGPGYEHLVKLFL